MPVYDSIAGTNAVVLSMPHSGTGLPDDMHHRLTDSAQQLPDTDWHVPRLYDFAKKLGVSILQAHYSRYVIDLNRSPDNKILYPGQTGTGLCPVSSFAGEALYRDRSTPDDDEVKSRIKDYWQPYHRKLQQLLDANIRRFGFAILYDCHTIRSRVPRLFKGQLPDLNLGTAAGDSCAADIENRLGHFLQKQPFDYAINGRFIGGYITRFYGKPANNVHAIQMELTQRNYMDEKPPYTFIPERARNLQSVLEEILQILLQTIPSRERT